MQFYLYEHNTALRKSMKSPKKFLHKYYLCLIHKQRQKYDHNQIHKTRTIINLCSFTRFKPFVVAAHSAQWYITKLVFKKNHLTGFVINKIPLSPQLAELWTSLPPDLAFPPRYTHPGSSQTGQSPAGTWIQRKMKMSLNVVIAGRIFVCEFTYCGPCE